MSEENKDNEVVEDVTQPEDVSDSEPNKWCFERIKESIDRNRNDRYKCWSEVIQILLQTCGLIVFFIFENFIGIVFIILGIVFVNACPVSPAIPISLLMYGTFSLIGGIVLQIIRSKSCRMNDSNDGFVTLAKVFLIVSSVGTALSLAIAFTAIYNVVQYVETDSSQSSSELYCNHFFFWFSFFYTTTLFTLFLLIISFFLSLICFLIIETRTNLQFIRPNVPVV